MKKNPNNTLFQLIKTMDRGERRFFNIFCNRQGKLKGKVYLRLFKDIQKQDQYDEAILKKEFSNYGKQFKMAKNYLYNLILDALAQHYNKNNKSSHDQLTEVKLLYEKGFLNLALKLVYKIRKTAEDREDYLTILETINWEKFLSGRIGTINTYDKINASPIENKRRNYMYLYNEIESYKEIYNEMNYYSRKYLRIYEPFLKKEFKDIFKHKLFMGLKKPTSTLAKWYLYMSRSEYYFVLGDYESSHKEFIILVKILESKPLFKNSNNYITALTLSNLIWSYVMLGKYKEALKKIQEFNIFHSRYPTYDITRLLRYTQTNELTIYRNMGIKNKAIHVIDKLNNTTTREKVLNFPDHRIIYFNIAITYLLFGEYNKSLGFLNDLLNIPMIDRVNPVIYTNTRIIQLILLFELKEYDLLHYKIRSLFRFLKKQHSLYQYNKLIMDLISKILRGIYTSDKLTLLYKNLLAAFDKITKNPIEAEASNFFDFKGWLESKIKNISYAELMVNRSKKIIT